MKKKEKKKIYDKKNLKHFPDKLVGILNPHPTQKKRIKICMIETTIGFLF